VSILIPLTVNMITEIGYSVSLALLIVHTLKVGTIHRDLHPSQQQVTL